MVGGWLVVSWWWWLWPARGWPGVGTHSGSAWPRYDIHYEPPGGPDPPPPPGFRDVYTSGGVRLSSGLRQRSSLFLSRLGSCAAKSQHHLKGVPR